MKTFNEFVNEKDDPCWKGYNMVGTKKKNGKDVPNCVKEDEIEERATSQLAGNLISLMSDDTKYSEIKDSMRKAIVGSPFFQGKSSDIKKAILSGIDKSKNVRDFEKIAKKYKLESLLVT